jgi:hypothetical protein
VAEAVVDGVLFSSPFCLFGLLLVGIMLQRLNIAIKH